MNDELEAAAAALRAGEVVLVPTDTVYGLAVDPSCPGATARLFAVKERPPAVPLPVLAASVRQAWTLAAEPPVVARRLAARWWPGPLTIVVARAAAVDFDLGGPNQATIGLRVPDVDAVRELAAAVGPLAVTSANLHGRPTPPTVDDVLADLGPAASRLAAVVDGGRLEGRPSTVVDCSAGGAVVLREGAIDEASIHEAEG